MQDRQSFPPLGTRDKTLKWNYIKNNSQLMSFSIKPQFKHPNNILFLFLSFISFLLYVAVVCVSQSVVTAPPSKTYSSI